MQLRNRIIKNYLSIFTSQVLGKVLNFFATLSLLYPYLQSQQFGEYSTVLAFVGFFNYLSDFGIAQIVTREVSKEKSLTEDYMGHFFSLQLLLSSITLAVIFIAAFLSKSIYSPTEVTGIYITGVGIAIGSLARPFSSILYATERMEFIGICLFVPSIINLAATFILIRLHAHIEYFFFINALNSLLTLILFYISIRYLSIPFKIRWSKTVYIRLLKFSLPLVSIMVFNFIYTNIDTLMIRYIKGASEVAYYVTADKFLDALILVPATLGSVFFPPLVKIYYNKKEEFNSLLQKSLKYTLAVCVFAAFETLLLAPKIISFIHAKDAYLSVLPLRILSLVVILAGSYTIYTNFLIAINRLKFLAIANFIALLINILLNIPFIIIYGYVGAAIVAVISELTILILYVVYVYMNFGYKEDIINVLKILIAASVLTGSILLTFKFNILVNIILSTVLFALTLLILNFLEKEDQRYIFNLFKII